MAGIVHGKSLMVTGAGGFIGSHLVERLVREGGLVTAFLHYNSRASMGNLVHLSPKVMQSIKVVHGDVQDYGSVLAAMDGCEVVFHLAALIGIPYSYAAPRSYVATNVGGTLNVLEAARSLGGVRVVHTSTSEVYGTALTVPIDEGHPLQAQSPYSASKMAADKLAESYHLSFGLPVVTVRPFNTYGPRQSGRAVIPTIIGQLLGGNGDVCLGSLAPMRDFNYVCDTVDAFVLAGISDDAIGRVVNAGSGKSISIGDLAYKIISLLGTGGKVVQGNDRRRPKGSEVMNLVCDNSLAADLLCWHPQTSLADGLQRTIRFFGDHPEALRNPMEYGV